MKTTRTSKAKTRLNHPTAQKRWAMYRSPIGMCHLVYLHEDGQFYFKTSPGAGKPCSWPVNHNGQWLDDNAVVRLPDDESYYFLQENGHLFKFRTEKEALAMKHARNN